MSYFGFGLGLIFEWIDATPYCRHRSITIIRVIISIIIHDAVGFFLASEKLQDLPCFVPITTIVDAR
jgi:hypothetical protein